MRRVLTEAGNRAAKASELRAIAGVLELQPLVAYEASERTAVREVVVEVSIVDTVRSFLSYDGDKEHQLLTKSLGTGGRLRRKK